MKKISIFIGLFVLVILSNSNVLAEEIVENDNSKLKVLRLQYEGVSPEFNPDILEYYITVLEEIQGCEVTAIPENANANVSITGNTNWKMGLNTISIIVETENKKTEYKIYVTRTNNKETANANLDNLAIKDMTLDPEFDSNVTKYKVDVPNETTELYMLAITHSEKATFKIEGNKDLKIGDNNIIITVTAENGITTKKYEILAHRRSVQEDLENQKQEKIQVERLSAILDTKDHQGQNYLKQIQKNNVENNTVWISIGGVLAVAVIICVVLVYFTHYKKMQKKLDKGK